MTAFWLHSPHPAEINTKCPSLRKFRVPRGSRMTPNSDSPGSQRSFRVGMLGTGVIAAPHAQALRSLGSAVELVAVCDRDLKKAKDFQQTFSVPSVFEDLDAMIAASRLDVVHVLLPLPPIPPPRLPASSGDATSLSKSLSASALRNAAP